MPHLYTTPPVILPEERWEHDRDPILLLRVPTDERPYFIKLKTIGTDSCRLSLLTTPIDLILTRHKEILLSAARQLNVQILKSNLGHRLKPDMGIHYLLEEKALFDFDWTSRHRSVFEIGSGNGSFLCEHALRNPEMLHFGAEINGFTMKKALRKAARARLKNIFFIRNDAQILLHYLFPNASLDTIFIHFPDPWEKKRYLKRRLINPESLRDFARTLKTGGEVHFTTDHQHYAEFTQRQFAGSPYFQLIEASDNAILPFPTKYERKWRSEGRRIVQFVFQRTALALPPQEGSDSLFPESFEISVNRDFSSEETFQAGKFVCVFKDVYKGPSYDVLDAVLTLGRYRWNIVFLKAPHRLIYDAGLNKRFLPHAIKRALASLFAPYPLPESEN